MRTGRCAGPIRSGLPLVVELLAALAIAALWFGYRRWRSFLFTMRALLRWRVLRAVFALELYAACWALAVVLPGMVIIAYQVYALPQFSSVSQHGGAAPSLAQEVLLALHAPVQGWDHVVILLAVLVALPLSFAGDRLLFVHGLRARLGPQSPSTSGGDEQRDPG